MSFEVAGMYALQVYVVDLTTGDKVSALVAATSLEVTPGPPVGIRVQSSASQGPVIVSGYDAFGNATSLSPEEFEVICENPNIQAMPLETLPPGTEASNLLQLSFIFTDYTVDEVLIRHIPSDSQVSAYVGYAPWQPVFLPPEGMDEIAPFYPSEGWGYQQDTTFEVLWKINIPADFPQGWQSFQINVGWPADSPFTLERIEPAQPGISISTEGPFEIEGQLVVNIIGETTNGKELRGEQAVFGLVFHTSSGHALPLSSTVSVLPPPPLLFDSHGFAITYDPNLFFGVPIGGISFINFPITVKPIKRLHMHIYRVQGAATNGQIAQDVRTAENIFNLNAFLCTLPFFVDFTFEITNIPLRDWRRIDEDNDGLDRFDSNGDGDYDDPGDNNDLFNAMLLNYFDIGVNTENIYYVPSIRGGAMGVTYWPNQQVAICLLYTSPSPRD